MVTGALTSDSVGEIRSELISKAGGVSEVGGAKRANVLRWETEVVMIFSCASTSDSSAIHSLLAAE